jgi:NADPH-dependent 2,4-dienoyl-CoA reductase/sulfur reductase-like enzyme
LKIQSVISKHAWQRSRPSSLSARFVAVLRCLAFQGASGEYPHPATPDRPAAESELVVRQRHGRMPRGGGNPCARSTRYAITIFGAEPRVNYNRIMLSPVLAGEKAFDDIVINDAHGMRQWHHAGFGRSGGGDRPRSKVVTSKSGRVEAYDRLLIATGSDPFIIPVPGKDLRAWSRSAIWTMWTRCWPRLLGAARWSSVAACWGWRRRMACLCAAWPSPSST